MELTRRDALAALAASGVVVGTGAVLGTDVEDEVFGDADDPSGTENPSDAGAFPEDRLATLLAVAEVVYPSAALGDEGSADGDSADEVSGGGVRPVLRARPDGGPTRLPRGMVAALSTLDEYARS